MLSKYLIKLYGEEQAKQLLLDNQTNLFGYHGLVYSLGKRSLEFFNRYFLQDTFQAKPDNSVRELAPFHYELWNTLEDMFIKDEFDKLELVMPRGSSKTTTCNFSLVVWAHCYKLSSYTLVCGKTEQDAVGFVQNIRQAFEDNPYIIAAFGELINTKKFTVNSLEIELANSTKISAISSSSSMRGRKYGSHRPSLIIADDYQGKIDVLTQESRNKKHQTWEEDCKYAGDKAVYRNEKKVKQATKFVVLGTILHRDCFMSRLLKDNTYKHIVKRVVDVDDIDEFFNNGLWADFKKILTNPKDKFAVENAKEFYYQNEDKMKFPVLWSDKYSCLDLAINDYYPNPSSFKQEYQNDASKIGEKAFHTVKTMSAEDIESNNFDLTILCCDPAVEVKSNNDFTALAVASKTSNNFKWIRKGIIQRYTFDEYINKVIELLKEYKNVSIVWTEKQTFNGADVREIKKIIENDSSLKYRNIEFINERQNKNKESKIRAISGKIDSGFIIFNEDDSDFYSQVLSYEGEQYSAHDDAADVVAECDRLLDTINTTSKLSVLPLSYLGL